MSARLFSLIPSLNSLFRIAAGSGFSAAAPKFLPSSAGDVALYLSF